jgi:GNAT superfamily N-acetyltransferase
MERIDIVERRPTVDEYAALVAAVGWKPRAPEAISRALQGSLYALCAEQAGVAVGMGRVIGDGGLHYYLTDVVVAPRHQRRGTGARIVRALADWLETIPFQNTWVGVFAVEGTAEFYARFGFRAQASTGPAMFRWLNRR